MGNERIPTGVPGLDSIVGGCGLIGQSLYLIKGVPGTGKTTIGLQFLLEGARRGERCLYLGLSETRGQLDALAKSFGWKLDGIDIHDMRRREAEGRRPGAYTVFTPSEVELEEIAREVLEQVDRVKPARLVLDSLSEIRLLADEPFRYRRELLVLVDQIAGRGCTGLLIDVDVDGDQGMVAETLVSGVVVVEQLSPEYGGDRRRLRVRKLRASPSLGGYHDMAIGGNGVSVYPRLNAVSRQVRHSTGALRSGIERLDALLGGGLDRGTSTVLIGPAGVGKSTLALQFLVHAAAQGESGVVLCFDESPTNMLIRATGLGIPLQEHVDSGLIRVITVEPAEFSPGELAHRIRGCVEDGVRVLVIDSLNGYVSAMPEERSLAAHVHELLAYLAEKGVATLLTQHGFFSMDSLPVNVSYIADTILLLRYFEAMGEVKQALSVLKKRTGRHERTISELQFTREGLRLGESIRCFQGVLSGVPRYLGPEFGGGPRESDE